MYIYTSRRGEIQTKPRRPPLFLVAKHICFTILGTSFIVRKHILFVYVTLLGCKHSLFLAAKRQILSFIGDIIHLRASSDVRVIELSN